MLLAKAMFTEGLLHLDLKVGSSHTSVRGHVTKESHFMGQMALGQKGLTS